MLPFCKNPINVIYSIRQNAISEKKEAPKKVSLETQQFHEEQQYLDLLQNILQNGEEREDRTGVGVRSLFGSTMCFSLQKSFPLLTTKKLHFKSIVYELLWFLRGDTNINYLNDHGVTIWNEWADKDGELGPVYGVQWRKWRAVNGESVDQIAQLVENLRNQPFSRRHILSAWNVGELKQMALPPCHILAQFYVSKQRQLSCQLYQRSVDVFLGLPFNIASYSLLTCILANVCDLTPNIFRFFGGDVHLYVNHLEQVQLQLQRQPHPFPTLRLNKRLTVPEELDYNDIELKDYHYHPAIPAPIAV